MVFAQGCYIPKHNLKTNVKSPVPYDYLRTEELPKDYDPFLSILPFHILDVISMVVLMYLLQRINIFLNIVVLVGLKDLLLLLPIV